MKKVNVRMMAGAVIGAAAVAGALALVEKTTNPPGEMGASDAGKEKCFGIVLAGENACASQGGNHTCAALSSLDYSGQEWTLVPSGTCQKMGGSLQAFDGVSQPPVKKENPSG